tara:strand:- start:630 stop:1208 length:579 start_codon:yes stop_codon:yes gene_type:complete
MNKEKVILTDCDGVLLDWEHAFTSWMRKHGHTVINEGCYGQAKRYGSTKDQMDVLIRMFNESAWMRKLPPLRDAIKYVRKLHTDHGYVFHAITSMSDDYYAQHLRTKNLRELFGDTAFETFVYLDTGADKDDVLLPYKNTGCFWVEDKMKNVDLGCTLGLTGVLMGHEHNVGYNGDAVRVQNWKEIYNIIVG